MFKVAMPWPLEPDGVREFAQGLDEILVVEEKRQIVEYQLKEQLYNWRDDVRPRVVGKFDEKGEWVAPRGEWLLTSKLDFSVAQVATVIASRIEKFYTSTAISERLAMLQAKEELLNRAVNTPPRPPYYCSGCPHNTSTKVPDGSVALAGIGCHAMAMAIYPDQNKLMTHMGGEGATWIGQAVFTDVPHVFQNLGDGTYFHSGYLAIRAAIASKVNITYKILYNDAVAMTGGQPVDGIVTVPSIAQQMVAEGVQRIALVTEDVSRYADRSMLPASVTIHDRINMDDVQKELRTVTGTSVLIYDQVCAAEKRRRRKKGTLEDPKVFTFINDAVCEGCGDCGEQSKCVSIMPLETEFGRKRSIDQSSCNKDYTCITGFCPSFVTVSGGSLHKSKRGTAQTDNFGELPNPILPQASTPYNILLNGIGGTGVIAVGALIGMAAHLEGKGVSVLDMTGMAQKNGAVTSHIRIADDVANIHAQRIATGEADLVLGCDILTAGAHEAVAKMRKGRTRAVVNTHQQPTGKFAQDADWQFPMHDVQSLIEQSIGQQAEFVDATKLATALMGDSIATNVFMVGFAYQKGLLPVSEAALLKGIDIIGVGVESNKKSFLWGRRAAFDLKRVEQIALPTQTILVHMPESLEKLIARRYDELVAYQDTAYADTYLALVQRTQAIESERQLGKKLTTAIAKNAFKLMAYKDEYEVARLYSHPDFMAKIKQQFDGDVMLTFHLAPPLFAKKDSQGHLIKQQFGPWMMRAFGWLANMKHLRGGMWDVFGRTAERRMERELRDDYMRTMGELNSTLNADNHATLVELATLPEHVRGFGHVKEKSVQTYQEKRLELLKNLD